MPPIGSRVVQPYRRGARNPSPALTAMTRGRTLAGTNPQDLVRAGQVLVRAGKTAQKQRPIVRPARPARPAPGPPNFPQFVPRRPGDYTPPLPLTPRRPRKVAPPNPSMGHAPPEMDQPRRTVRDKQGRYRIEPPTALQEIYRSLIGGAWHGPPPDELYNKPRLGWYGVAPGDWRGAPRYHRYGGADDPLLV